MDKKKATSALLAILAIGLAIRLAHFVAISQTNFPEVMVQIGDSGPYWKWAQQIMAGDWLGRDTYHPYWDWMKPIAPLDVWYRWWGGKEVFYQAPLYPYFLAGLLSLSGGSVETVMLVQLAVGVFQPLLVFWLTREVFSARAGLIAAALTAAYGPFVLHQTMVLRDWLIPILDGALLLILLRASRDGRRRWWLLAGILFGLSYVTKSSILLFVPFVLWWIGWRHRQAWPKALEACGLLGLGCLIILAPVCIRNLSVGAPLWSTSTRISEGFIIGNAADGDPVGLFMVPPSTKSILEHSQGRILVVITDTLKTFNGDLSRFLEFQILKLRGILNPYEVPNSENFYYVMQISPVLRFLAGYGVVLPLGIMGLLLRTNRQTAQLLWWYLLIELIALWAQPIRARYRLPLVQVLIVFGSAFLPEFWGWVRGGLSIRVAGIVILCGSLVAVQYGLVALSDERYYFSSKIFLIAAENYAANEQFPQAIEEIEKVRRKVRDVPQVSAMDPYLVSIQQTHRIQWTKQLLKAGEHQRAREQLTLLQQEYGELVGADYPHSHLYDLGLLYEALGEPTKAQMAYELFLAREAEGVLAEHARESVKRLDAEINR